MIEGVRCVRCGHPAAFARPRCQVCRGPVEPAAFGPLGTVWSSTVVRVDLPGAPAPRGLAYVDVDGGPRVLAAAPGERPLAVGSRVRVTSPAAGSFAVEVVG